MREVGIEERTHHTDLWYSSVDVVGGGAVAVYLNMLESVIQEV